jgi:hypothetical protein
MEPLAPIPLPAAANAAEEAALNEVDTAIVLVSEGVANRVRIASIAEPIADRVIGAAAARTSEARVRFNVDRGDGVVTFNVGPRVRALSSS